MTLDMFIIKEILNLKGVIEGLKYLVKKLFGFIVTNQAGITKGIFKEEDFFNYNRLLVRN